MSEKQQKQNTVFMVIESRNRDGDSEGSPQVTLFSNIKAAREHLKELVTIESRGGLLCCYNPKDPYDDWEITTEDNLFHAWSESASSWIIFEIVEKIIHETA